MSGKAQNEHSESAYTSTADIKADIDLRRSGPEGDMAPSDQSVGIRSECRNFPSPLER